MHIILHMLNITLIISSSIDDFTTYIYIYIYIYIYMKIKVYLPKFTKILPDVYQKPRVALWENSGVSYNNKVVRI